MIRSLDQVISFGKNKKVKISFKLQHKGFLTAGAGKTGLRRTRSNTHEIQYCQRNQIKLFKKGKL